MVHKQDKEQKLMLVQEKVQENPEQSREVHFAKEEKRLRYEYLRQQLKKYCNKTNEVWREGISAS